jgi:hypothetical protein
VFDAGPGGCGVKERKTANSSPPPHGFSWPVCHATTSAHPERPAGPRFVHSS